MASIVPLELEIERYRLLIPLLPLNLSKTGKRDARKDQDFTALYFQSGRQLEESIATGHFGSFPRHLHRSDHPSLERSFHEKI